MASHLSRTGAMLRFPRYLPTLIARAQASQNPPVSTPGQGVPMTGSTKTVSQTGGTKPGDSSVLPASSTKSDKSNPTKTSSDAPPLSHESIDTDDKKPNRQQQQRRESSTSGSSSKTSSSQDSKSQQSFLGSTVGQVGAIVVVAVGLYAGYQMISGEKKGKDLKDNDHYKRATADYQAANTQGTDVKK